jgi:hypothetical protein
MARSSDHSDTAAGISHDDATCRDPTKADIGGGGSDALLEAATVYDKVR